MSFSQSDDALGNMDEALMFGRFLLTSSVVVGLSLGFEPAFAAQDAAEPSQVLAVDKPDSGKNWGQKGAVETSTADLDADAAADIDDRFTTEGYAGVFLSAMQSSVPSLGLTGSIFLDDDFRAGIDFWRGRSKGLFSSFTSQGAGLWVSFELGDRFWMKGGLSYSRIDRPTSQEPLAALFKSKGSIDPRPSRTDSIQADFALGQLWTFQKFTLATDYLGFSLPFMTLTGPKQSSFNLVALRADILYNID